MEKRDQTLFEQRCRVNQQKIDDVIYTAKPLRHRTIRHFTQKPIPESILDQLRAVCRSGGSSLHLQQYSVIEITDRSLLAELAKIGKQSYISDMPMVWIFIADSHRNLAYLNGVDQDTKTTLPFYRFIQGFQDACLAAHNVNQAIEGLGLGAVFLGSLLNDVSKLISLLKLPRHTFPVIGLGFGEPANSPQYKPKLEVKSIFHCNQYRCLTDEACQAELADYDIWQTQYVDLRNPKITSRPFKEQIRSHYATLPHPDWLQWISDQGYDI